ncbi:MAG: SprB repeat-containing protein [Bacteroidetes bacterium]|nr:SprB repeat-containing protein [Bacteroidota bacterium]
MAFTIFGCGSPIIANPVMVSSATCGNSDAELTANPTGGDGSYSYSWAPAGGTGQSTGQTLTPGMYTVTVSDTSGCTAEGMVWALGLQVDAMFSTSIDCNGGGALNCNANLGQGAFSYLWSNGATTQNISGLTVAGGYTVTVSDTTGCSLSDSVILIDSRMNITFDLFLQLVETTMLIYIRMQMGHTFQLSHGLVLLGLLLQINFFIILHLGYTLSRLQIQFVQQILIV